MQRRRSKAQRLLARILEARAATNIRFADLRRLLLSLGFEERTRGSHHMFSRSDIPELINLQGEGGDAKPYQVRQIRRIILRYGLHEAADE